MTTTPAQFAAKMARTAAAMRTVDRTIVQRCAQTQKTAVQQQLRVAAPSGRLNVGKNGKRIGVRYDLHAHSARLSMFGPAHLIESDTKAHRIPKVSTSGRRSKPKLLTIPGVGVRRTAMHPGTRGKHPWAKALAVGLPKVDKVARRVVSDTLRQSMGG